MGKKCNAMLQEFYFSSPKLLIRRVNIYYLSFYGSKLSVLYYPQVDKIYKSWNVTVSNILPFPGKHIIIVTGLRSFQIAFIQRPSLQVSSSSFLTSPSLQVSSSMSCRKNGVRFLVSLCIYNHRTAVR